VDLKSELETTLQILTADTSSLSELAYFSKRDQLTFYQGSDLSGLDLSGQDLTGLNFDRADLRSCNLANVNYDKGAFNGSKINSEFEELQDDFDCFLEDAIDDRITSGVYIFATFREETFHETISRAGLNYDRLATLSKISLTTIRKARRSGVVALDTASALSRVILDSLQVRDVSQANSYQRRIRAQPMIRFLELLQGGGFRPIPRAKILQLAETSVRVDAARYPNGKPYQWRRGPEMLRWLDSAHSAESPWLALAYGDEEPEFDL